MPTTDLSADLIEAYTRARYSACVDGFTLVLAIGQRSETVARAMAARSATSAAFITAENPYSVMQTEAENSSNQSRLHADLIALGAGVFDGSGEGSDARWPAEASFLAIGITPDQARMLGKKYAQNALLIIDAQGTAYLELLR